MVSSIDIYLIANIFGALTVIFLYGFLWVKDKKNWGYYVAPISWAVNSLLFYSVYFIFGKTLSTGFYNTWASIIDLQAFILITAVGIFLLWAKFMRGKN